MSNSGHKSHGQKIIFLSTLTTVRRGVIQALCFLLTRDFQSVCDDTNDFGLTVCFGCLLSQASCVCLYLNFFVMVLNYFV